MSRYQSSEEICVMRAIYFTEFGIYWHRLRKKRNLKNEGAVKISMIYLCLVSVIHIHYNVYSAFQHAL